MHVPTNLHVLKHIPQSIHAFAIYNGVKYKSAKEEEEEEYKPCWRV